ncbi:nifU-like protein 2 [Populus alba x Populus x berolinensis]|nr:nifU-like protein 2 [Populus alba x Populus x berolinensis]
MPSWRIQHPKQNKRRLSTPLSFPSPINHCPLFPFLAKIQNKGRSREMQSVVWNPTHCSAQQTLDTSCSSPLPRLLHHKSCKGFFGARARSANQLRQGTPCHSLRARLPSFAQRRLVVKAVATPDSAVELPLTADNVESVLDEVRPYLISDGGNVALHEIDGNVVRLKLQGACSSCSASVTTMKMGIESRLMEKIPEIVAVEAISDEETGLELNEENIEKDFCGSAVHFIKAPQVAAFKIQYLIRAVSDWQCSAFHDGWVDMYILMSSSFFLCKHPCFPLPEEAYNTCMYMQVLEEIRPYLVGAAGGSLELVAIEEPIVKIRITGPAAGVMTVRVAVTQKLREKIPAIAAVQLL